MFEARVDDDAPRDPKSPARRVFIETFGCQMNDRDSSAMLARLGDEGYEATERPEDADLILLNTCSVRDHAEQKVYSSLGRYRSLKEDRPDLVIGVGGCVAQQLGERLMERVPDVDLVFGPHHIERVPELVARARDEGRSQLSVGFRRRWDEVINDPEAADATGFKAQVAVQRGCDRFCSFCIVPFTQGREISRPAASVLAEVERLAGEGVCEVTLLGQNITSYGRKDPGDPGLSGLLRKIAEVRGIERIRFITSHPAEIEDDLIDAFREIPQLAAHIHLPVQCGSDAVLARMRRGYTRRSYEALAARLRAARPGLAISTDFIVGFPGESEGDFEETLDLMRSVRFDSSFSFTYSERPGTRALKVEDDVPAEEKARRLQALLALQREISLEANQRLVGSVLEVLVDGVNGREPSEVGGRSSCFRRVYFPGELAELAGRTVEVEIVRAGPLALRGHAVGG